MPKPRGFIEPKYVYTSDFKGGINASQPAAHIQDNQAQDLSNLVYIRGVMQVDTGYRQAGDIVAGAPLQPIQFQLDSGTFITCLVTTVAFYAWDSGIGDWQIAQSAIHSTTTTAAVSNGPWTLDFSNDFGPLDTSSAVVSLTSVTGLVVGDVVSILCTNNHYFNTQIASISGLNVTMTDPLPQGYAIASGAAAQFFTAFRGGAYAISWTVDPTTNTLIWTNGVDEVQAFSGGVTAPLGGLYAIATAARVVIRFFGYTIAMGTTEGGTYVPYRVRWSTPVSSTDWSSAAAGYDDLSDTPDPIYAAGIVAGVLVIARQQSIMIASFWGVSYATFYFQYAVVGTGILGYGGLANTRNALVFVSSSNVYGYVGDYNPIPIGDNIFDLTLGAYGNLDPVNANQLFLFYVNELDEIWFFYPTKGNADCNSLLRYNLKYKSWWVRNLGTNISGCCPVLNSSALEWNQIVGSWASRNGVTWGQSSTGGNFPLIMMASPTDRVTYIYDYATQLDNNNPITWYYISKDYPILNEKLILDGINVYGSGNFTVAVSTDSGYSWNTVGDFQAAPHPGTLVKRLLDYTLTSQFFRFQISGTDPTFSLTDIAVRYMDASEY